MNSASEWYAIYKSESHVVRALKMAYVGLVASASERNVICKSGSHVLRVKEES